MTTGNQPQRNFKPDFIIIVPFFPLSVLPTYLISLKYFYRLARVHPFEILSLNAIVLKSGKLNYNVEWSQGKLNTLQPNMAKNQSVSQKLTMEQTKRKAQLELPPHFLMLAHQIHETPFQY